MSSSSSTTIKISVPSINARNWASMAEVKAVFSDEEIVTMVHRYCDAQDHARNYRVRRAEEFKALKARVAEIDSPTLKS